MIVQILANLPYGLKYRGAVSIDQFIHVKTIFMVWLTTSWANQDKSQYFFRRAISSSNKFPTGKLWAYVPSLEVFRVAAYCSSWRSFIFDKISSRRLFIWNGKVESTAPRFWCMLFSNAALERVNSLKRWRSVRIYPVIFLLKLIRTLHISSLETLFFSPYRNIFCFLWRSQFLIYRRTE